MPTYTYRCTKCNKVQEVQCRISEASEEKYCIECNGILERIFTPDSIPSLGPGTIQSSPQWFKDRLEKINKDLGTNAKVYK